MGLYLLKRFFLLSVVKWVFYISNVKLKHTVHCKYLHNLNKSATAVIMEGKGAK